MEKQYTNKKILNQSYNEEIENLTINNDFQKQGFNSGIIGKVYLTKTLNKRL